MPVVSPVDKVHLSSSPREPQTLRSFMDEYKKKLQYKNEKYPKKPMSKDKERIASSSWIQPKKKIFIVEEPMEVNPRLIAPKPILSLVEVNPSMKSSSHVTKSSHQVQLSSGTYLTESTLSLVFL